MAINTPRIKQKWYLLADAPLDTLGMIWSPELPDRTDIVGTVYAYHDGERSTTSACQGYVFTHWHPLNNPPGVV